MVDVCYIWYLSLLDKGKDMNKPNEKPVCPHCGSEDVRERKQNANKPDDKRGDTRCRGCGRVFWV